MNKVLTLLTWPDYISPETLQQFESEFGIKVELELVPSAVELIERMQTDNSGVDVLVPPDYAVRELSAQGLVGSDHERRALELFDEPGGCGALAGAGRAEQHRVAVAAPHPSVELGDGRRLVTGRLEFADDLEAAVESWDVERHADHRTSRV